MKKTLITAVALAACAGTQLFAQNAKEDVITFALTGQAQSSVSDNTGNNQGGWTTPAPIAATFYKTSSTKVATADILKAIAIVLHKNAGYYSSKAQLVLVQGELSGFFNLTEELADIGDNITGAPATIQSDFGTTFADTTLLGGGTVAKLASGRHFLPNPITGAWPVGHHQPWGQIFVKDPGKAGFSATDPLCENVTFFFSITVEECYDCFYLNSFISDAKFKFVNGSGSGIPCCGVLESLQGNGKDRYYMTLSFDNTLNNPYLNGTIEGNAAWVGGFGQNTDITAADYNPYLGIEGIGSVTLVADGISADLLPYSENIISSIGLPSPFEMRFTLNGIVTYTWVLKLINTSDLVYDFVGSASYAANGYGFIALRCGYLTGTASMVEKIVKGSNCCLGGMFKDGLWFDWWYGTGWNQAQSPWFAFNPATPDPFGFGSPVNMAADLSMHIGFDEEYEAGEQWYTNPTATVPLDTPLDIGHPKNYVPVGGGAR
jgi:hypothetical protein